MIRRRRRAREIPFSFDSFLDIVANVVGIIIRLILVVWVGARSYSSVQHISKPAYAPVAELAPPADPLEAELDNLRRRLAQAQEILLKQLHQLESTKTQETLVSNQIAALAPSRLSLATEEAGLVKYTELLQSNALTVSSAELRERSSRVVAEIRNLAQAPAAKHTLRYRTPISRPVQSEELLFECRSGRVTFIDIAALLTQVREGIEEKGKLLRTNWEVTDVTSPAGAFRLRYAVERERGLLDALGTQTPPESSGGFRYGLSEWQIEPIALARGEMSEAAFAAGSEFRQIADGIDPQQTAVTFWVYPDSFDLFRRLRDYLYVRDIVVAGRPLPDGVPISSSRRGTVSRGQ
jgi:hypothetical protein